MSRLTFVTGNPAKAALLATLLGMEVDHVSLDLPEPQALDYRTIVEQKVRAAYDVVRGPALVEDSGVRILRHGRLPGTLVKWFIEEIGIEGICRFADGGDRSAEGEVCYGYYDGGEVRFFEGRVQGSIAEHPRGDGGFGWDPLFIHDGDTLTRGELPPDEAAARSMRAAPLRELRTFLGGA